MIEDRLHDELQFTYVDPSHNLLQRRIIRLIEELTGQPKLRRLYIEYRDSKRPHREFFNAAIEKLEIDVRYDEEALAAVADQGPIVFVAALQ